MKKPKDMTDEELFDAIREQVNLSRSLIGHNRIRTRELAEEAHKRGWNLGSKSNFKSIKKSK